MTKYILLLFLSSFSIAVFAQNTYNEVSLPQLMEKVKQGGKDYLILDVRTKGEHYDTLASGKHLNIGRIRGAVNIPIQDLQQKPEALQQLNDYKDKDVYVICSHSYRSRTISNLLLRNGFTKVSNVQGGMTEWYRNYEEMKPYTSMLEKNISYTNISPSQLFDKIKSKEPIQFIGFKNAPRFFFDSLVVHFYKHFPDLRNTVYFTAADSAGVLNLARSAKGRSIVLFNTIGAGGGEMASWLTQNGVENVNYLIGNLAGFFEYMVNYQPKEKEEKYFSSSSNIRFYSAMSLCRAMEKPGAIQLVDLRHDTLFAKPTNGTKLTYQHLKGAVNFPYYKPADDFAQQFADKSKIYVILAHQNYRGMELAEALLTKGYKIGWLIGGNERWEWYTNNIPSFSCKDQFVK